MPIVATAGHVDHGKSTLVEALTGRDPDRWAEEKERGLTIDLGFAWTSIGAHNVGFVDVPGHERFIKNMLAGMGAIDVALFVVAADEGWMPQSEEHLAVLDLLDTRHGVIALTRIDLATADAVDLAELSILEAVEETRLANWPIVRVSPVTGKGMDELLLALERELDNAGPSRDVGRPRLWVDRSFRIAGTGLVVTGTLSGGSVATGDEMMIWPGAKRVRIRSLQQHDRPVASLSPGSRSALNLSGVDHVARGDMLGAPDSFGTTMAFLAILRSVRSLEEQITPRGAFQLHVGSGAWPVELRIIDDSPPHTACLLRSKAPIPLQYGDRFILRETGRRTVVAGGRVIDPHPAQGRSALRAAVPRLTAALDRDSDAAADALLEVRGTWPLAGLACDSGGGTPASPFKTSREAMAPSAAERLLASVIDAVASFHRENRLRPGIPKAELASTLDVAQDAVSMVVAGAAQLDDDGATVRAAGFEPGLDAVEQASWDSARAQLGESLAVPRASRLGLNQELFHALVRDGQLVRIAADLVYLPGQISQIRAVVESIDAEFTVAEFRDLLGVTRRQAIPLLEWLDNQGITRRHGDVRVVRRG